MITSFLACFVNINKMVLKKSNCQRWHRTDERTTKCYDNNSGSSKLKQRVCFICKKSSSGIGSIHDRLFHSKLPDLQWPDVAPVRRLFHNDVTINEPSNSCAIRNIGTKVASMFTRTCRLSWRHLDCRDVIKICGQLWSQMQPYMKFWASFSKIYRFQKAKPIRKLTIQIGLACLNRKI